MPITLNHSNISVQYSTGSNYIIETVKSDLYLRDTRTDITSNLLAEPILISPAMTETVRTFIHSGGTETQTSHTITVGQNTICDILIVGGGGGGSAGHGGGGGAGQLVLINNAILSGTYTIKVGKGGNGTTLSGTNQTMGTKTEGTKGSNSEFGNASINVIAEGGGISVDNTLKDGGSGAGGDGHTPDGGVGGKGLKNTTVDTFSSGTVYSRGNDGGDGSAATNGNVGQGGGGGGAGSAGTAGGLNTDSAIGHGGDGLSGISQINYDFKTNFGNYGKLESDGNYWFAGGGAGGTYYQSSSVVSNGGKGGGGSTPASVAYAKINGGVGMNGTGGGGAGGTAWYGNGGNGGSGIVIIKFKSTTNAGILDGITHKRLNFAYNSDNLVAWYKFNGDYLDSSGKGHNLTNVGTVIQSTQVIEGQAVEFDSTDYLEFPATINPYTIWNGKGISFSCWVRFTAQETWGSLIFFQTDVSNNTGIGFWIKTTPVGSIVAIYLRVDSTIFQYGDANTPLIANLNVWRHFVLCVGISGKMDVYLDNVRINGTETANIPNLTYNARYINRGRGDLGTWDGQMDDFRIYDRALSAADVSLLYNKTYSIPPNIYTLNFPVPTITDINNNSNIVLRGAYDISLSTMNSSIIPKSNQYIIPPTTFTNYGVERMYPPVRNFTAATTTVSGQTYGNGTYVVSFSSTLGSGLDPWTCFNTANAVGGHWASSRYTSGVFNSTSFIVAGYLGDWIKIQLPVAIKLTRFEFLMRTETQGIRERSPKDFKIYGSNDNITWVELVNKIGAVYDSSFRYTQLTQDIITAYTYYGLVVNKLLGSTADVLNFDEWYIYGQEVLSTPLSIRYNLLNPLLDPIGAQWTYNSSNTNVYHMGSVGIGTKSPEYQLDVRGFIHTSVGGYTQTGSENWIIQSDRRIKENIVKASYDKCLENVKNIELYNFNFKDNCVNTNDRHQLGFIAQEVQQVYPKAVEVGKIILDNNQGINDLLTLNTTQIKYTLYGAVKNLIERVENIESRVEQIYNMTLSSNFKSPSSNISISIINTSNIAVSTSNISASTSNIATSNI